MNHDINELKGCSLQSLLKRRGLFGLTWLSCVSAGNTNGIALGALDAGSELIVLDRNHGRKSSELVRLRSAHAFNCVDGHDKRVSLNLALGGLIWLFFLLISRVFDGVLIGIRIRSVSGVLDRVNNFLLFLWVMRIGPRILRWILLNRLRLLIAVLAWVLGSVGGELWLVTRVTGHLLWGVAGLLLGCIAGRGGHLLWLVGGVAGHLLLLVPRGWHRLGSVVHRGHRWLLILRCGHLLLLVTRNWHLLRHVSRHLHLLRSLLGVALVLVSILIVLGCGYSGDYRDAKEGAHNFKVYFFII